MTVRTATAALLAGAIVLLAIGLVGQATDALAEGAVDALAIAGLGLLAAGQAVRAWFDRRPRTILILVLILALIGFVLLD